MILPQIKKLKKVSKVYTLSSCDFNSRLYCIGIEIEKNENYSTSFCYSNKNKKVCKEFIKTYYPDYLSVFEKETE